MKLEAAHIKRYRSASDVELPSIGDFNVFIGKNNSGKSTLLRAIRAFFHCLEKGNAVALKPVLGKDKVDFSSGSQGRLLLRPNSVCHGNNARVHVQFHR